MAQTRKWYAANRERICARRRPYYRRWVAANREHVRAYKRLHAQRRYVARREYVYRMIGRTACVLCGSRERLEFHHRDPRTKLFTIGDGRELFRPLAELRREAKKCDLLCDVHHRAAHRAMQRKREAA